MRSATLLAFAPLLLASPRAPRAPTSSSASRFENGQAGRPQPGVLLTPARKQQRRCRRRSSCSRGNAQGGTTTVRPEFGGGYSVENSATGAKTKVKPHFGGGYSVEKNGRTTTEVKPNFGGGYSVESTKDSPTLILPPSAALTPLTLPLGGA